MTFNAPSGRRFYAPDLQLIATLEENSTIGWSETDIPFNSGFLSRVYFNGRNDLSHNPPLLMQVADMLKTRIEAQRLTHGPRWCAIGIPTAGSQLAQAISHLSWEDERLRPQIPYKRPPIVFSTMRSVLKLDHGKNNMWVGPPQLDKFSPFTVENVVSTAKAMLEKFAQLEQDGYPTREMHHAVFMSWELGGSNRLPARGYERVHILYLMMDAIAALVYMGKWPEQRYVEMNRRIRKWNATH